MVAEMGTPVWGTHFTAKELWEWTLGHEIRWWCLGYTMQWQAVSQNPGTACLTEQPGPPLTKASLTTAVSECANLEQPPVVSQHHCSVPREEQLAT